MSWKDRCLSFVKKHGKAAKAIAGGVLNVVAPGSGALLSLVGLACDKACDVAHDQWEHSLLQATQNNTAELQRLGQLFELLSGDLAGLCDKAAAFAEQPDGLADIIGVAIAADPGLARGLHSIEAIKTQFDAFQADLRRLARNQEEALPVYERMNRMADYFDELRQAGISPTAFAQQVKRHQEVAARITSGDTRNLEELIRAIRKTTPKADTPR